MAKTSKRQGKKKPRQKQVRTEAGIDEEAIVGPFEITRRGTVVGLKANWTAQEAAGLREKLKTETPKAMVSLREALLALLAPYNALDAITVGELVARVDPEIELEVFPALVEYLALLLLARPSEAGTLLTRPPSDQLASDMKTAVRAAGKLFTYSNNYRIATIAAEPETQPTGLPGEVIVRNALYGITVRRAAYWSQQRATLIDLFGHGQIDEVTRAQLGVGIEEIVTVVEYLRLAGDRAISQVASALNGVTGSMALVATARMQLTYDVPRVATGCGLAETKVRAVVDLFTTPFDTSRKTPLYFMSRHDLMRAPLVASQDGRFVCASFLLLDDAVRPALERTLRNAGAWDAYDKHRAAYLEERVALLLEAAVKPVTPAIRQAKFEFNEAGGLVHGESDVMLVEDDALFIVECKAGSVDPRGRPRQDVEDLIADACRQADKAQRALRASCVFEGANGTLDASALDRVQHVFPIVVTLEDISWVAPALLNLQQAGIIGLTEELPWAVTLHDLDLIVSLTEHPAQLVYYLELRRRLNACGGVVVHDELDLFVCYLDKRITQLLDKKKQGEKYVQVSNWTGDLDAYVERAAPKPAMVLPDEIRTSLSSLESGRKPGHLANEVALLRREIE